MFKKVWPASVKFTLRGSKGKVALFAAMLGLAWLICFIFLDDAYRQLAFQIGPGLISYVDIYVGILFVYSCIIFLRMRVIQSLRRYLGIMLISFCSLTLIGFILGNPPKDIFADWKRIWGLFAGVTLAVVFQESRFEPAKIASVVFGLIPLVLCSLAILLKYGLEEDLVHLGTQGLYVSSQVWAPWLPILLCRSAMRQNNPLYLPLVVLGVLIMIPSLETRVLALSVAVSLIGFFLWYLRKGDKKTVNSILPRRATLESELRSDIYDSGDLLASGTKQCASRVDRIRRKESAENRTFLALVSAIGFCVMLVWVISLPSHSRLVGSFVSRLSPGDSPAKENVAIRIDEIEEMARSMNALNYLLGKGMGGTYYFSIADLRWVAWGLYTTPYLPAPHILIAGLFLKGGVLLFLAGGILYPLTKVFAFCSGLARKKKEYLLTLAPYDLAILAAFAMLYTSCQFDAMPLLSISLIVSLRFFARRKVTSP